MSECNIMRFIDLLLSILALLLFSPILVCIVIILSLTGEGEIFYKQERIGRNGRKFLILKFATMLKDSPNLGAGNITVKDDPRVLPFGLFLRKTKINELPQLINVVKGDMALIGPRPLTEDNFAAYAPNVQRSIHSLRPGLSGIGSIVFRDEEELLSGPNASPIFYVEYIAPYKGELEKWYASHRNIVVDICLIFLTIICVILPASSSLSKIFSDLPQMPEELMEAMKGL